MKISLKEIKEISNEMSDLPNNLYSLMKGGRYFDIDFLKKNYLKEIHWDDINEFLSINPKAITASSNTEFSKKKLYIYELDGVTYKTKTSLLKEIEDTLDNFIPTHISITVIHKSANGAEKIVLNNSTGKNIKYQISNPLNGVISTYDTEGDCNTAITAIGDTEKNNYKNLLTNNTFEIIGDNNNPNIKLRIPYDGK
jgi:hypothetical protein